LWPADLAAEYLHTRWLHILPAYVVAMAPFSLAMVLLFDVITSQHAAVLGPACALLTATTVWRWAGLIFVQRRIQADLRGADLLPLRGRVLPILLLRLASNFALCWGSFLVVPAYYGLFISGFAVPMMLERGASAWTQLAHTLSWTSRSSRRLGRVLAGLAVLGFLAALSLAAVLIFVVHVAVPGVLGLDTTDLALTLGSWPGLLCAGYALFLLADVFWTVISVMLYYDLQSRRLGSDLRLRLNALLEEAA
jgi:hypothetical protein